MTSLPPAISSNTMIKYFLPVLPHIVMPFVVVALIFFILCVACAYFLQGSRFLRVLVDGLIVLSFLVVAAIMVPIVFNTLKFPDAESAEVAAIMVTLEHLKRQGFTTKKARKFRLFEYS